MLDIYEIFTVNARWRTQFPRSRLRATNGCEFHTTDPQDQKEDAWKITKIYELSRAGCCSEF